MSENIKLIKKLIKTKSSPKNKSLRAGNFVIFKYNAKDKSKSYDRIPLVFILWSTNSYMLGLNFHYLPRILRISFLKMILKINHHNIKNNKNIEIDYQKVKPYLWRFGFFPVVRLYIRKRISNYVLNIPNENINQVVLTSVEEFTGSNTTSDILYKKAIKSFRKVKNKLNGFFSKGV